MSDSLLMHSIAAVAGIVSLLAAGFLSGVGIHDGVLGQTAIDPLPTAREPVPVTLRVAVAGTPVPAHEMLVPLADTQQSLTVPAKLQAAIDEGGLYVPLDVEGYEPPGAMPVMARFADGATPAPGEHLVVTGELRVHQALVEDADGMRPVPLVLLEANSVRHPLVFA